MSDDDVVLIDDPAEHVRRLTLNRPTKRNALSHALRSALFDALRAADRDPDVRVVVIRGAGPCFSAGYDLAQDPSERPPWTISPADGGWARHVLQGWFEMMDLSIPIIAQVHGYCLAGGTELATACDLVYVADDAEIGYPPVRSMSSPDMGWHVWLMGMRRAMEAMLTGDSMSGVEAVEAGFANRSFPVDDLDAAVLAVAETSCEGPGRSAGAEQTGRASGDGVDGNAQRDACHRGHQRDRLPPAQFDRVPPSLP